MSELEIFPESWNLVKIGDICKQRKENTMPTGKGERYVGLEHIDPGESSLKHFGYDTEVKSSKYRFYSGDILYGKLRPYLDKAVITEFKGICSTDIIVLTANELEISPSYLVNLLHLSYFVHYSISTMKGVNHPRTSWREISKFEIPLPSLQEQKKIVAILSIVQKTKETAKKLVEATRALKKSLEKHLFTYGPVHIKEIENVKLKDTEIGKIPEGWDVENLRNIFKLTSGKTRPKNISPTPNIEHKYAVYGGNGIMGYSNEYLIDFDTIVIGRVGAYCGSVYLIHGKNWISDNALYMKEFLKKCNLYYLAIALELLDLNKLRNLGAQPLISQSIVYSQNIPLPPLPIQQQIASILSCIDEKIKKEEIKKKALEILFKSMLHNLMTGKIEV